MTFRGGSPSRTSNQHCVNNRLLDQPAGSRRVYWIEIAEGDDRRSALVQDVEPDALECASTILGHLNFAQLVPSWSDLLGLGIDSTGDGPKGSPAPPQPWRLGAFAAPGGIPPKVIRPERAYGLVPSHRRRDGDGRPWWTLMYRRAPTAATEKRWCR